MKFRRKQAEATSAEEVEATEDPTPATGPFDVDDIDPEAGGRVDLGSLIVAPMEGRELRMQVDEPTQRVQAVMYASPEGALELRAFAAPRGGGLWDEVRGQIRDDMTGRGAIVEEREGPFGPELACQLPVELPDGQKGVQPSRVIGIEGPRWFLRATLLGIPAQVPEKAAEWEEALRQVAVRRGAGAMAPGEALPLTLPPQARRVP